MMFLRLGDRFKKAGLAWLAVACLGVLGGATSLAGASAGPVFTTPSAGSEASAMGVTYPISVSGTYVPLAMDCGSSKRVLWYAPGATGDFLWTEIKFPETGSPTFVSSPVSVPDSAIAGGYQPVVGDFNGDECEDIYWYAPGPATDAFWQFNREGTFTTRIPTQQNLNMTPIVGTFDPAGSADLRDDIFWYAAGSTAETIWRGRVTTPGSFDSTAAPAVSGTYTPVLAVDESSILWFQSGPGVDYLWRGIEAGTTTANSSPTTVNGTYTARNLGGTALLYAPGTNPDQLITGAEKGPGPVLLKGIAGAISGTYIVSSSTSRAGFGVLHAPGAAPDYLIRPKAKAEVYRRTMVAGGPGELAPNAVVNGAGFGSLGYLALVDSAASNLVEGDTNAQRDVFLWDIDYVGLIGGTGYLRQPNGVGGAQPNNSSNAVGVDIASGRSLIESFASNLVAGDTNSEKDMFVWDPAGGSAYQRQPNGVGGTQNLLTDAVAWSTAGIALFSSASNNVVAGDTNSRQDVFVWDTVANTYQRQPLGVGGAQPNGVSTPEAISLDGTKVVFTSEASNLVASDTNGLKDVFVWNRSTNTVQRQPLGVGGAQPNNLTTSATISPDGTKVVVNSRASNLVAGDTNTNPDMFLWNLAAGTYQRQPSGLSGVQPDSISTAISIDVFGRVSFDSLASNLVAGDTNGINDVFVWDTIAGTYLRQPRGLLGAQPNAGSQVQAASFDGNRIFLSSNATNLVAEDVTLVPDGFVWTRVTPLGVPGS